VTRMSPECEVTYQDAAINLTLVCAISRYHKGRHQTRRGTTWTDPAPVTDEHPRATETACGTPLVKGIPSPWCLRTPGHTGPHSLYTDTP